MNLGIPLRLALAFGLSTIPADWTIVSSPNPSSQANYLTSTSVITASDVWAVGAWYRPQATPGTLTLHWDGAVWSQVRSPNATGGYNELYAVDAVATNDVWAVGYHNISEFGSEKTMAVHWDGIRWTIIPSANSSPGANFLLGVAAVASNDVWGVGLAYSPNARASRPMIEHWDGTRWSVVPSPNPGPGFGGLNSIVALSASDVWAVGNHEDDTLIEHWDGSTWSIVASPNGSRTDSELYGISAVSATDVWAVGESSGSNSSDAFTLHWDGSAWTVVPAPNGSKPFTSLVSVSALSPSDAWAVGYSNDPIRVQYRTVTEHWDGSSWTVVPSPNPDSEINGLGGVAGISGGDVWAVGSTGPDTLVLRTTDA